MKNRNLWFRWPAIGMAEYKFIKGGESAKTIPAEWILIFGAMVFSALATIVWAASPVAATPGDEFDNPLQGWTIKGKGAAEARAGGLCAENVELSKSFLVDLDKHPICEIKVEEAKTNFVIKASISNQAPCIIVRANRPGIFRDNLPIKCHGPQEIRLHLYLGDSPFRIDYVRFLPPPQRAPDRIPDAAAALPPPARAGAEHRQAAWYLVNRDVSVAIWRTNGCVAAGWVAAASNDVAPVKFLSYCSDLYRLETSDGEIQAFEHDDQVIESRSSDNGRRIELVCRNPVFPGLEIRKAYWLRPEPNIVAKRVEFRAAKEEKNLFHWVHDVALDSAFREGGYYNNRDYHPVRDAFIPADDVRFPIHQPEGQQVYFVSPRYGLTAASYRIRANDHLVGPWCYFTGKGSSKGAAETDQYFTPRGWQFKAHLDAFGAQTPPSAEVHYTAVRGDFSHFHRQFMALPEFKEANNLVVPEWVSKIKGYGPTQITPDNKPDSNVNLLDDGLAIRFYRIGSKYGSPCGWEATPVSADDDVYLRNLRQSARTYAPRLKIGIYAWLHSVSPGNPALAEHPDWFIRGYDGKYIQDNTGMYSRLLVPEHVEYIRNQIRYAQTNYDMDFFYVDGGGFGRTDVDQATGRVVQPYDYMRMYEGTRVAGRPSFFNAINGLRGFYNAMGFFEGFIEVKDWRALSIKMFEVKLYQQPGTWSMPLYLTANNLQEYANYTILFGFKPQADTYIRNHLPLINMCYELAETGIRNAGVFPCWWKERTDLEAYILEPRDPAPRAGGKETRSDREETKNAVAAAADSPQKYPGAFFVTLLNHGRETREYEIGFDQALSGLEPGRPVYVYHMRTAPAADLWTSRLSEPEDRELYLRAGWCPIMLPTIEAFEEFTGPDAAARQRRSIQPNKVELLGVSQTPAMIWSVNGHRKYFPLSRTRWGTVTGGREGDVVRLEAHCTNDAEIAVFIPATWGLIAVELDGKIINHCRLLPGLAVVPVGAGEHKVIIHHTPPKEIPVRKLESIVINERVEQGKPLIIRAVFDKPLDRPAQAVVALALGANPVYASPALTLAGGTNELNFAATVPKILAPGAYNLFITFEGVRLENATSSWGVSRPLTVDVAPIAAPAGWDSRGNAVDETKDVNRSFTYSSHRVECKVLRTFAQTYRLNPANIAKIDVQSVHDNKLTIGLATHMGDERTAGYAHAGVELENIRAFRANIAFNRSPQKDGQEIFALDPRAHVSFSVDFHTSTGYVKRVYFHVNPANGTFGAGSKPWWGTTVGKSDVRSEVQLKSFNEALLHGQRRWDLVDYAPAGWDGRVILGVNLSMAAPGTAFFMRVIPESKFSAVAAADGAEKSRENYTYLPLRPILKGADAIANLNETNMELSATAPSSDTYALTGFREWNFLIPRLRVQAEGNSFIIVDYLTDKGTGKRVFALLSGDGPDLMTDRLKQIGGLDVCAGPVEIVDLRGEIQAATENYDFGLGKFAYQGWAEKSKRALFRVGVLGPNGRIRVKIIQNDDFWQF